MHALEQQLLGDWPLSQWHDLPVLVAVSGGPDSVALLRALLAAADTGRIVIGHFNHRLRGDESDADERFVDDLAAQWKVPCEIGHAQVDLGAGEGDGMEAAARDERYAFLQSAAERHGARYLVTAHTADDQVETVLHRVLRGTGIAGLGGIPRLRQLSAATTVIRPLLGVRRSEVLAYLGDLRQSFRTDSSNTGRDFTRNRIRNDLLPRLEQEYNPRVAEAILRLSRLATEVQGTLDDRAEELADRAVVLGSSSGFAPPAGSALTIDCRQLADQPSVIIREMLVKLWRRRTWPEQAMSLAHWDRLAQLGGDRERGPAQSETAAKQMFPGGIVAERQGAYLRLQSDRDVTTD